MFIVFQCHKLDGLGHAQRLDRSIRHQKVMVYPTGHIAVNLLDARFGIDNHGVELISQQPQGAFQQAVYRTETTLLLRSPQSNKGQLIAFFQCLKQTIIDALLKIGFFRGAALFPLVQRLFTHIVEGFCSLQVEGNAESTGVIGVDQQGSLLCFGPEDIGQQRR